MLSNKFKVNYSIGAVANGVKTDTFTFFLLFFYSNIIGLNPGLAGSAIFIALCIDAVSDPLMGTISDRTNFIIRTKASIHVHFIYTNVFRIYISICSKTRLGYVSN